MKPIELSMEFELIKNFLPHGIELQDLDPHGHQVYALPVYNSDGKADYREYISYLTQPHPTDGEKHSFFGFSFSIDEPLQDFRRRFFDAVHDFQEALNGS